MFSCNCYVRVICSATNIHSAYQTQSRILKSMWGNKLEIGGFYLFTEISVKNLKRV